MAATHAWGWWDDQPTPTTINTSLLYVNTTTAAFRSGTGRDAGPGGPAGISSGEGGGGDDSNGIGEMGSCHDWQDAQHTLFQLANLCMAASFLTPVSFRFHVLFLRCLLLVAFLLFVLWAGLFICMADILGWNIVFFLLDAGHVAWLFYRHLPTRMPLTHTSLYTKVFKPIRVTQAEFLDLCEVGRVQNLCRGGLYTGMSTFKQNERSILLTLVLFHAPLSTV
nr:hypothetical protein BaRGS_032106 [Batillaria attramentaria]